MTASGNSNIRIVQQIYAAFGRGDIAALLDYLDEDIEWLFNGGGADIPYSGPRRGHDGVARYFTLVAESVEVLAFSPMKIIAGDDDVAVLGHERARAKITGQEFETYWLHLFTLADGKVVRLRGFYDTATMAAAFRV
jgi:hypothetical protein